MLLAIDTSTSAVTVALHDGTRVIAEHNAAQERRHAEVLMPAVAEVFARAGIARERIDRIVVGVGPGPFTGLRVGIVTASTLGVALDRPVDGVCSLDALAFAALRAGHDGDLVTATDARRKEVYWACYELADGQVRRVTGPAVSRPAELPEQIRDLAVVGRGAAIYPGHFGAQLGPLDVQAGCLAGFAVAEWAAGRALLPTTPLYLREPDAVPQTAVKSVIV